MASLPLLPTRSRSASSSRSGSPDVPAVSGRSRSPVRQQYRHRHRSTSPPAVSDDEIDPSLQGMDGLHVGQRATSARRRNPGKYTDKSIRQAHSRRSNRRERSAALPAIIGANDNVRGTCVNDFGTIKPCRDLVTRVNYRTTYVNRNRLPLQMLFAMLLDEQSEVVHTYNGKRVREYLGGVILRALSGSDPVEPTGARNLVGFANRAVTLLSQIHTMTGDTDPIVVLAERYLQAFGDIRTAREIIKSSIDHCPDPTVQDILVNLQTLVNDASPQARLWSYDSQSPSDFRTVMLRRGQLRDHPIEQLKRTLEESIRLFRAGGDIERLADGVVEQDEIPPLRDDGDIERIPYRGVTARRRGRPRGRRPRVSRGGSVRPRSGDRGATSAHGTVPRNTRSMTAERGRRRTGHSSGERHAAGPDLDAPSTSSAQPAERRDRSSTAVSRGRGRGKGKRPAVDTQPAEAIPDWMADVLNDL